MKIEVKDMDQTGNGIGYIDNKIVFIKNGITGDVLDISIDTEKSKYLKAHINKILKPSDKRVTSLCPNFEKCGGCQLWNMNYQNTLEYKLNRIKNILKPLNINTSIEVIPNECDKNYHTQS